MTEDSNKKGPRAAAEAPPGSQDAGRWDLFSRWLYHDRESGLMVDVSRAGLGPDALDRTSRMTAAAVEEMRALEAGALANRDEGRMVGHYWLRDPSKAPDPALRDEISRVVESVKRFASDVHAGRVAPAISGGSAAPGGTTSAPGVGGVPRFESFLVVGIGGSALGPQFVSAALGTPGDPMRPFFMDNTDPDGMDLVLGSIPDFSRTLAIVISKSGGTKETRNGQVVVKRAFEAAGVDPARHLVAVTGEGSELDKTALAEGWAARFPMWDWVGGRTSELSAVGLLPAALQGFDVDAMLHGAARTDRLTMNPDPAENPALLLSLSWHHAGSGRGLRDMVVLPYKDRLQLFSKYLQQLVMESLGKEFDRSGERVHQGISVFGNKGSTDQHAYVQQLRDGIDNFFVTFVEVLADAPVRRASGLPVETWEVEPGRTCGDYLSGFLLGTREALSEKGRLSVTVTVPRADAAGVGSLIALFERAVGFYGSFVNVNAYHQPGVEAGKKAAEEVLALQKDLVAFLASDGGRHSAPEIAGRLGRPAVAERVFKIAWRLAECGVLARSVDGSVGEARFSVR